MATSHETFRAGVGAVIQRYDGDVLALERADHRGSWQLPQGGLKLGEEPQEAVLREVQEETGLSPDALELVGRPPDLLAYELPPEARSRKTGRGQVQYWFVFRFLRRDDAIRLPRRGEFCAWEWWPMSHVTGATVEFRRPVYRRLEMYLSELESHRRRN